MTWKPIETAPKDGSTFEAWYVSPHGPKFGPMQWQPKIDKKGVDRGRFHSWTALTETKLATHWRQASNGPSI